ncbi:MAG: hypothetical protein WBD07_08295 [Vicinamibacterales bacterium]
MTATRRRFTIVLLAFVASFALARSASHLAAADLPARLTDKEFWSLTETLSEPGGAFRSDNFLSNERGYQQIIPDLLEQIGTGRGGVYMGVGPEQNFAYIVALKPRMAFIVDIRRGNLHEHLLYKALFEMSATRADFLSRLFSRGRPAGLGAGSTAAELFNAYDNVQRSEDLYKENLKAVTDWLTRRHGFPLSSDDVRGIEYVYHDAFFIGGPQLDYSMGGGIGGGNSPTYRELMLANDGYGRNRGFLATEENFSVMKDLETKNLLVPVVGNFGGPKAIRAVGQYVKERGGTVLAFYLSNVEQYLAQDGIWGNFCSSVATLPLDDTSTFIYSGRGGPNAVTRGRPTRFGGGGGGGGGLQTTIRPIRRDLVLCASGGN